MRRTTGKKKAESLLHSSVSTIGWSIDACGSLELLVYCVAWIYLSSIRFVFVLSEHCRESNGIPSLLSIFGLEQKTNGCPVKWSTHATTTNIVCVCDINNERLLKLLLLNIIFHCVFAPLRFQFNAGAHKFVCSFCQNNIFFAIIIRMKRLILNSV